MGTLTFLFTDIEGSTGLLRRLGEDGYAHVLAGHHALIRSSLAAAGGEEVDTQGDAFFAVFSSPRACVAAVAEMQQAIAAQVWPAGEQVRVRMGVHTGEASKAGTGLVGLDVHRAARVAAVANGGQVLLSESAAVLVRDTLPPGTALRDLGEHRLKDLGRPERIFQLSMTGLQREFPPLRSLGNPVLANNLPAQLATFVGRERELSQVRALAGSSRLVTLAGPGGAGKTRLALQVAADLLDGSGDGVWLVELAAVSDENAVVPAICEVLGVAARGGGPDLEALIDAVAPQDVLLVLDNCEHLVGACAKTAEAVLRRCLRVNLLVTSREPLGIGGETIYRVPPLSLPDAADGDVAATQFSDAVALFAARATEQGTGFALDEETGPVVASICRRLDGMPLAIELAAARLRSMSLAGLRDRLDQRFRLLTGGSRTALPRQQTLLATVEWSHSLLSADEQVLLRRLSVFAESFDLDAAEAVCGFGDLEAFDVAGLLGSLVDKSLVVAEPAGATLRYRLLETIRQFGAERLAEVADEETAAETAHCGHFLALAEAAALHLTGRDQAVWCARLDADQANLRRAAERAGRDPDATRQVLRFGVALRYYWLARSREREAAGLLPALERSQALADPGLFAAALVTAVVCAREAGLPAARPVAERAVEIARQLGDDRLLIEALSVLCASCSFAGQPGQGFAFGQEAVERARRLGDDFLLGFSLLLWLLTSEVMDPAQAEPLYAEGIAATERSGDWSRKYRLHNNAGNDALRAGNLTAARVHLDQAAEAMRSFGTDSSHLIAVNQGWLLREEDAVGAAQHMFEVGLRAGRRNGDRSGLACASLGLACLAADRGDWPRAAELHGAAQAFIDQIAEPWQALEARYRRDSVEKIRTSYGEDQFARAYAKGMALTLEQALGLALGTAGVAASELPLSGGLPG